MLMMNLRYLIDPKAFIKEHGNYNLTAEAKERVINHITQNDFSFVKYYRDENILNISIYYAAWYVAANFHKRVFFLTSCEKRRKFFLESVKRILTDNNVIISRNNKNNFETDSLNFVTSSVYSIIAGIGSNYELVIVDDLGNCENGLEPIIHLMPIIKNKVIVFSKPGQNNFFNSLVEGINEESHFSLLDLTSVIDLSIIMIPIKPPYSINSMDKTFPIKIYS